MLGCGLDQGVGLVASPPCVALLGLATGGGPRLYVSGARLGGEDCAATSRRHGIPSAPHQQQAQAALLGGEGSQPFKGVSARAGPPVHGPGGFQQRGGAIIGRQQDAAVDEFLGQPAVARGKPFYPAGQPCTLHVGGAARGRALSGPRAGLRAVHVDVSFVRTTE